MGLVAARVRNAPALIGVLSFISSVAKDPSQEHDSAPAPSILGRHAMHREQKQNKASNVRETKKHRPSAFYVEQKESCYLPHPDQPILNPHLRPRVGFTPWRKPFYLTRCIGPFDTHFLPGYSLCSDELKRLRVRHNTRPCILPLPLPVLNYGCLHAIRYGG